MKRLYCPKCHMELVPLSDTPKKDFLKQTWWCSICNIDITTLEPINAEDEVITVVDLK